jgi:hypothetical protein
LPDECCAGSGFLRGSGASSRAELALSSIVGGHRRAVTIPPRWWVAPALKTASWRAAPTPRLRVGNVEGLRFARRVLRGIRVLAWIRGVKPSRVRLEQHRRRAVTIPPRWWVAPALKTDPIGHSGTPPRMNPSVPVGAGRHGSPLVARIAARIATRRLGAGDHVARGRWSRPRLWWSALGWWGLWGGLACRSSLHQRSRTRKSESGNSFAGNSPVI